MQRLPEVALEVDRCAGGLCCIVFRSPRHVGTASALVGSCSQSQARACTCALSVRLRVQVHVDASMLMRELGRRSSSHLFDARAIGDGDGLRGGVCLCVCCDFARTHWLQCELWHSRSGPSEAACTSGGFSALFCVCTGRFTHTLVADPHASAAGQRASANANRAGAAREKQDVVCDAHRRDAVFAVKALRLAACVAKSLVLVRAWKTADVAQHPHHPRQHCGPTSPDDARLLVFASRLSDLTHCSAATRFASQRRTSRRRVVLCSMRWRCSCCCPPPCALVPRPQPEGRCAPTHIKWVDEAARRGSGVSWASN